MLHGWLQCKTLTCLLALDNSTMNFMSYKNNVENFKYISWSYYYNFQLLFYTSIVCYKHILIVFSNIMHNLRLLHFFLSYYNFIYAYTFFFLNTGIIMFINVYVCAILVVVVILIKYSLDCNYQRRTRASLLRCFHFSFSFVV